MKLYFNENFEVVKRDEENIYRGSEKFNELHVYFPRNEFFKYYAIYPIFSYKRSDGREGGELAFTQSSSSDGEWYEWYDVLPKKALEINGVLQITVAFKSVKNENDVIKKTVTGKALLTIKDAVVSDADIIYTDSAENTVKSMTTQIDAARVSIESLKARYNAFDLGELQQDPYEINHTLLNNIKEANTYHFNFQNNGYLMFVKSDENSCVQTILTTNGLETINFFDRIMLNDNWSLGRINTVAKLSEFENYYKKHEVYNKNETYPKEVLYRKDQTYSRDEALAIGLIEVSEYNAKTGEITVTYNPNTVDVTYNEDTGELVFSQKTYLFDSDALPKKIRTLKLGLSEVEINNIKHNLAQNLAQDLTALENALSSGAFKVRYAETADVAKTAETAGLTMKNEPIASKNDLTAYDEAKNIVSVIKKYVNADGSLKAKYDGNGNQINTTYATQKMLTDLIGGAPEAYNTLKEIADYINEDKTGASSMLSSIQNNASNIAKNSNDIAELDQKIANVESNIAKEIAEALEGEY